VGSVYITSTEPGSGKALVSLGIIDLVLRKSAKVCFFRPIISKSTSNDDWYYGEEDSHDEDIELIVKHFRLDQTYEESYGLHTKEANALLGQNREDDLINCIISKYKALEAKADFVVCEGSDYLSKGAAVEFNLNQTIAKNLGLSIVVVASAFDRPIPETINSVQIAIDAYRAYEAEVVAIVLNKADPSQTDALEMELKKMYEEEDYNFAVIPNDQRLSCPRMSDIVKALRGQVLCGHNHLNGLVRCSIVCAMQLQNALKWVTEDDSLLVTSGDRGDIIVGALQAHQSRNYPKLAGIILTGGVLPDASILRLVNGLPERLPIVSVQTGTFATASQVNTGT
jgi:phosphate acetyltransferase